MPRTRPSRKSTTGTPRNAGNVRQGIVCCERRRRKYLSDPQSRTGERSPRCLKMPQASLRPNLPSPQHYREQTGTRPL
jgi:hypothetical protein